MGCLSKAINVWIPLTPVGGDYPGLELWLSNPQQAMLSLDMSPEQRERVETWLMDQCETAQAVEDVAVRLCEPLPAGRPETVWTRF